jgi:sulfate transport system ATP-binding protein
VQSGKALFGPLAIEYPEHPHNEAREAEGYARPHELEISRTGEGGGLRATVVDVRVSGAVVKMEVNDEYGRAIQIEQGREQHDVTRAIVGEEIYVKPRRVRVFMNN